MKSKTHTERGQSQLRRLDRIIGVPLIFLLGLTKVRSNKQPLQPAKVGIMIFGAIGDALLASSVLDSLRKNMPNSQLILLVSKGNQGVKELIFGYDLVKVVEVTHPVHAIQMVRQLRLDLLIDTSQWPRISALIAFFSGARFTVGFKTPSQCRHFAYDSTVLHQNDRHELNNFIALAVHAGGAAEATPLVNPVQHFDPHSLGIKRPYVIFHPWAAGFKSYLREWPEENWCLLADKLVTAGFDIVITGGPADVEKTNILCDVLGHPDHVSSAAGKLSMYRLKDCIGAAQAVISVNTGVMHLAALCGAVTLSLNGPTNGDRWGGIGSNTCNINVPADQGGGFLNLGFEYPAEDRVIMDKISVDQVFSCLLTQIKSAEQR